MEKENSIAPINEELNIVNNVTNYETENIKNLIYNIRGKQVMLDSDVAMLYHYDTKRINETVKRNVERFPIEFCFQLTNNEYNILKSQIATSNENLGLQIVLQVFYLKRRNTIFKVAICNFKFYNSICG